MRKILTIFTLSIGLILFDSTGLVSQELIYNKTLETKKDEKKENSLVLSTNNSNETNVEILLSGIGTNPKLTKEISNDLITLVIETTSLENINSLQSLSIPSVGIKTLTLSGTEDTIRIV